MNQLQNASSPYLLQHAANPVDWYEWGPEALERARRQDRPIFLSIGYSACHWCHVMAHESFQDPQTAALMNEGFVNIKVDREQRPDLDGLYMRAAQAMTGSGGWPLSVFLTPDLQPFFAGTYFPPVPRHNLPAFQEVLASIAQAWKQERGEIERLGAQVLEGLRRSAAPREAAQDFDLGLLEAATASLLEAYDWQGGGWGVAPKFPQPMLIEFLLQRTAGGDERALPAARHALQAMGRGGMYDVVAGGFARYSTDSAWHVPHFEKMLYDNGQLACVYLHAWQVTGDVPFARTAQACLDFVLRELTGPEGGFYASLDADSEGREGSFYVWEQAELRQELGPDFDLFRAAYGTTESGNWEGKIVLQRLLDDASLAARFGLDPEQVLEKLDRCHARLLVTRSKRTRPATDDKVLTGWNGLMLSAFAQAARTFPDPVAAARYREAAVRNARFLLQAMRPGGRLVRTWRAGRTSPQVFLEDYSSLTLGLLDLYQTDFDPGWFASARELADEMISRFADPAGGFFDTPTDGESLPLRLKDLQDNAVPAGNALAAEALLKLAALSDSHRYRELAEGTLELAAGSASRYPAAFGRWLSVAGWALANVKQIALLGDPQAPATRALLAEVRSAYRPLAVVACSGLPLDEKSPPLLLGRSLLEGQPTAYVCEGFVCQRPVRSVEELRKLL
jgi:uncharacterized protein YyaL (SSP411 family)